MGKSPSTLADLPQPLDDPVGDPVRTADATMAVRSGLLVGGTLEAMPGSVDSTNSLLSAHQLETDLVPSPVEYRILRPSPRVAPAPARGLPLLVFLHGGGGSAEFLDTLVPIFEGLWTGGTIPPMVVATPSAGRNFYLDRFDGTVLWERFLFSEFIPHLIKTTGAGRDWGAVALAGVSMGGLGALRLAFRRPDRFVAVAVLEPGIEESTTWNDVLLRDRVYRDDALMHELFGNPIDSDHFHNNHPRAIAERNGHLIAAAGLDVYFECGDQDVLHLQYGAEALHRQLFAQGIDHEYRLVRGGDHLGPSLPNRFTDALRFLGDSIAALDEPTPEPDPVVEMFAAYITPQELDRGYRRTEIVDGPDGPLEVHLMGEGHSVVLIPSRGGGGADFRVLAARLARSGYKVIAPEPRGIGASDGGLEGLTMADLANDVAFMIRAAGGAPATVVGHAFGNRVARMVATLYPDLVESVVLLACGGLIPPSPAVSAALRAVFDSELTQEEHIAAVSTAFFAAGNDASVWADGWHADVAAAQVLADRSTPQQTWWTAGCSDVLVVQPAEDVIALPENAMDITEELGPRASMMTIPHAGHALLPEQPAAIAVGLLTWLDNRLD
jgi:S-formylglutathione hydrolase